MARKVYVDVFAKILKDGQVLPYVVIWEDGKTFEVDKVLDIRPAASLKAGGTGIRYTCRISNKETYLFYEENKWFVEAKN